MCKIRRVMHHTIAAMLEKHKDSHHPAHMGCCVFHSNLFGGTIQPAITRDDISTCSQKPTQQPDLQHANSLEHPAVVQLLRWNVQRLYTRLKCRL